MNANLGKTDFTEVEVADLQDRLKRLKDEQKLTWKQLGQSLGIAESTIAAFASKTYKGDNQELAAKAHRYFLAAEESEELQASLPAIPDFIQTPTSKRVWTCLAIAQQGDMTAVAGAPGLGKTATVTQYQATRPNVWVAQARPSMGALPPLLLALLRRMGNSNAKGTPQVLSELICEKVTGSKGLIVIDDAQHLTLMALEELRTIHDQTGVGVALIGEERLIAQLRPHSQLFSRIGVKHAQRLPMNDDITLIAEAWGIAKGPELAFCLDIGKRGGGLRTLTKTLRNATFLARQDCTPVHINHLRDAYSQGDVEVGV